MLFAAFSVFLLLGVFVLSWFKRRRDTYVPVREVVSRFTVCCVRLTYEYGM